MLTSIQLSHDNRSPESSTLVGYMSIMQDVPQKCFRQVLQNHKKSATFSAFLAAFPPCDRGHPRVFLRRPLSVPDNGAPPCLARRLTTKFPGDGTATITGSKDGQPWKMTSTNIQGAPRSTTQPAMFARARPVVCQTVGRERQVATETGQRLGARDERVACTKE